MKKLVIVLIISLLVCNVSFSQPDRWQQRVKYVMNVDVDVTTNRFTGKQQLEYTNNSPDTLKKVFYHLYWNAFQPGSMMDVRSRELGKLGRGDWDPRVRDRISKLTETEIGYQKVLSLKMNGVAQSYVMRETILEVRLTRPILPKSKVTFEMEFESQVPVQIRRSGRDAANGVRYSMSQWYPKLCEYDSYGWHPTPYIAREFYGVWGDYDVRITIDKNYILGGTGYLQNANQIGYGYEAGGTKINRPASEKLTWHFLAPNVHDFVWAADPDYKHLKTQIPNGPVIHVLYRNVSDSREKDSASQQSLDFSKKVWAFLEKQYGEYPYKQYSFIEGGDGGMEYPM